MGLYSPVTPIRKVPCYPYMMRWLSQSRFAQAVAMTLLLWTGTDLSNASLCALDSDRLGGLFSYEFTPTLSADATNQAPARPSRSIDDCFCCSHCVDVQALVRTIVAEPIARREPPLDTATPRGFGLPLYHPPLA